MKKLLLPIFIIVVLFLQQCSNNENKSSNVKQSIKKDEPVLDVKRGRDDNNVKNEDYVYAPLKNRSSIYQKLQNDIKKEQKYLIHESNDTIILCKEGTKLSIRKNSFEFENGTVPQKNDEILIQVKEFYKISDMIRFNLSTTSNGELLETGGMFHIEAYSNNKKLYLRKNTTIGIVPSTKNNQDMEVFTGVLKNNQINWEIIRGSNKGTIVNTDYDKIDFCKLKDEISFQNTIKYPQEALANNVSGSVIVDCWITESGNLCTYEVEASPHESLTYEVLKKLTKDIPFIPTKYNNKAICAKTRLWVNFINKNNKRKIEVKCLKQYFVKF